jgi:zinc transport system substrate-binding protein
VVTASILPRVITRIVLILVGAGAVVAGVGAVAGCGGEASAGNGGREAVVAGFYPLAFAAEEIGGRDVDVTNLTPAGSEPHDIELSVRDVEHVLDADLVLYLGDGFQPALEEAAGETQGEAVDVLDGLDVTDDDPHVWLDPVRYARMVETIGRALGKETAAEALAARVRALDAEYRTGLADCERHELVASHAAFGYLAERYGLEQIAATGLSPEAEPGPRDVERVVDLAREHGATTVFVEPLVSPDLAETIAREAGAKTAVLDPLEGLTEDSLAAGDDYLSVMRANLAAIREALECR